jgi:ferric enterobactin receptor
MIRFLGTLGLCKALMCFILFYFLGLSKAVAQLQQPLSKTLVQLQQKYGVYFSYDAQYANVQVGVVSHADETAESQLKRILQNTNLYYDKISNNIYVIRSKPNRITPSPKKKIAWIFSPPPFDTTTRIRYLKEVDVNNTFSDSLSYHLLIDRIPLSKANLLPSVFGKDVFASLQYTAGVSSIVEPATGLYVRGSTPDQSLILLDGIPIFNADHPLSTHSFLNAGLISKVDFKKGYVSPRLGGKNGAYLDMQTKPHGSSRKTSVEIGWWGVETTTHQPLSKNISVAASWRSSLPTGANKRLASQLIDYRSLIQELNNGGYTSRSWSNDVLTNLDVRLQRNAYLKATFFYANDTYQRQYGWQVDTSQTQDVSMAALLPLKSVYQWKNKGASLQYNKAWDAMHSTKVVASWSANAQTSQTDWKPQPPIPDSAMFFGYVSNITGDQNNGSSLYSIGVEHFINKPAYSLNMGVQWMMYQNKYTNLETGGYWTISQVNNYYREYGSLSAYAEIEFPIGAKGKIKSGLRIAQWGTAKKPLGEPRVQWVQKIRNWTAEIYFTRHRQAFKKLTTQAIPTLFNGVWYLADGETIPISKADMLGGSLKYHKKGFTFAMQVYQKWLSHLTEIGFKYQQRPAVGFDEGNGKTTGVELTCMKEGEHGLFRLDYTYNNSLLRFDVLSSGRYFKAPYLPKHEVKALAVYKFQHWYGSITGVLGIDRPYAIQKYFLADASVINIILEPNEYNMQSLSPFHRIDLSIGYKIKAHWQLNLDVQNIYNRANEWYKLMNPDQTTTTVSQLGILANLKLKFDF